MAKNGQLLCQELEISLCSPSRKVSYMPTGMGHGAPLTLAMCRPGWDDYQDLGETVGRDVPMLDRRGWAAGRSDAERGHSSETEGHCPDHGTASQR